MKKIIRGLLAIILLFTLTLNVKAVEITTDNTKQGTTDTNSYLVTNTGTITINNASDNFRAYKIIDYFYNSTTNELSYEFTDTFKTFLSTTVDYKTLTIDDYKNLSSGNITNYSVQSDSDLDKLASLYVAYVEDNNIESNSLTTTRPTDGYTRPHADGNLEVGSYLVLPFHSGNIYAVMVGNIDLTKESDEWKIEDAIINAKVSVSNVTRYTELTKNHEFNGRTINLVELNERYIYHVDINVPEFPTNSTTNTFGIYDRLIGEAIDFTSFSTLIIKDGDKQLEIKDVEHNTTSIDAKIYNEEVEVGTISYIDKPAENGNEPVRGLDILFNANKITSDSVKIAYDAKLNSNANVGTIGNLSETIFCSSSPYSNSEDCIGSGFTTVYDTVYSYGIKINTKDKSNNNLTGAQYKLYSDSGLNEEIGTFVSNGTENTVTGLAPGTYYVKQVTAPNGSSTLNTETFTVNVDESQEGYVTLDVTNSGVGLLPVTGGAGTIAFIVVGLLVVIAAFAYYVVRNKKKINNVV